MADRDEQNTKTRETDKVHPVKNEKRQDIQRSSVELRVKYKDNSVDLYRSNHWCNYLDVILYSFICMVSLMLSVGKIDTYTT